MERAERPRSRRQGALHRRLVDVGVAVREGPARGRGERLEPLRVDAGPVQPAAARGGARDAPALHRREGGRSALVAARAWPAHARLGCRDRAHGQGSLRGDALLRRTTTRIARSWMPWPRSRRSAASRAPRSPSRGCAAVGGDGAHRGSHVPSTSTTPSPRRHPAESPSSRSCESRVHASRSRGVLSRRAVSPASGSAATRSMGPPTSAIMSPAGSCDGAIDGATERVGDQHQQSAEHHRDRDDTAVPRARPGCGRGAGPRARRSRPCRLRRRPTAASTAARASTPRRVRSGGTPRMRGVSSSIGEQIELAAHGPQHRDREQQHDRDRQHVGQRRPYVVPDSQVRMRGVSHGSERSSRNVVTALIAIAAADADEHEAIGQEDRRATRAGR